MKYTYLNRKCRLALHFFTRFIKKLSAKRFFRASKDTESASWSKFFEEVNIKMSLKRKLVTAATSAFAVVAFSTFVSAQDSSATAPQDGMQKQERPDRKGYGKRGGKGMHGGKFGKRGGGMRELRGIELTDAQKEQIRGIREANRPDETTREEIKTLAQAKRAGTLTSDQQTRLQTLKQDARLKGEAVQQQIRAVLTPEQLQQIETKKAEMRQKWEERKQMRQQRQQTTPQTESKDN